MSDTEIKFSPLAQLTLPIVETMINAVLAQDPVSMSKLNLLTGKIIGVQMTKPSHCAYLLIMDDSVTLQHHFEGTPDLILRASLTAFIKLTTSKNPTVTLLSEEVEVIGDTSLAQSLQNIAQELEIDWEGQLANVVGGVAAHQLGNVVRTAVTQSKIKGAHFLSDIKEYLQEELQVIPNPAQTEHYRDQIDTLKMQVERMQAQINRLTDQLHKPQ